MYITYIPDNSFDVRHLLFKKILMFLKYFFYMVSRRYKTTLLLFFLSFLLF